MSNNEVHTKIREISFKKAAVQQSTKERSLNGLVAPHVPESTIYSILGKSGDYNDKHLLDHEDLLYLIQYLYYRCSQLASVVEV